MKKIIYIAFAAAALLAVSCQEQYIGPDVPEIPSEGLVLSFSCGELATKADNVAGVSNENLIKQIEYFFFPLNAEGKVDPTTEYAYKGKLVPTDNGLAGTYTETVVPGVLKEIFPDGATEAVVFAVANYCEAGEGGVTAVTDIPATAKTWQDLHGLEVGMTFTKDGGAGFGLRWPRPMATDDPNLFFVMAADSVGVQLKTSGEFAVNAEIPLERLASKVTVAFTYEEVTDSKGVTWRPQPNNKETRVYLSNAICNTTLGGPLTRTLNPDGGTETAPSANRDVFEYAYDFTKDFVDTTPYYYTYPISMDAGDINQPYLKLVMVWNGYKTIDGVETFYKSKEVYYKIALPRETITEPNRIYEYTVNVNILGSDKEVNIPGDYVVKDWLHGDPVSSNLATGRYISLEIPKDEYDMYVDSITISFVSSGTVVAQVDSIYQWNYSAESPSKNIFMLNDNFEGAHGKGVTEAQVKSWATVPNETSYLQINHELCNDLSVTPVTRFDAAPYIYVVTLHLVEAGDDTSFDRTVTITQYPAMYITARTNTNYSHSNNNDYYGYVYVNSQTQNHNNDNWYVVRGLDGSNKNPNMYLISTSVTGEDYIIGDPRAFDYNTWGYQFGTGAWTESSGNNHRLTYYYPTRTDSDSKKVVAPLFRVASSYGVCGNAITAEEARYRCASYQEDGYPAGRWRVPTTSEVQYIATLSAKGFIPTLFNVGGTYYSASGAVSIQNGGNVTETTSNSAFVRCVYDEWYWGSERLSDINVFTWGDKQR